MLPLPIQKYINQVIAQSLGRKNIDVSFQPVGGGSINQAYRVATEDLLFFLKVNSAIQFPHLFEKEMNGLAFIRTQQIISTPHVIACEKTESYQLLLLEWIQPGTKTVQFWKQFGEELARLHHVHHTHFGFVEDNYMGALPQSNKPAEKWFEFFIQSRLQPQLALAQKKGLLRPHHFSAFEKLYKRLPEIFNEEPPSLLHGDLWSGNFMCNDHEQPVLIDPAVYFGHRSIDLGMTTLFGGFDRVFYDAYHHHFPLTSNHEEQWEVSNLYPLLIHVNLFGAGYLSHVNRILEKYC